MSHPNPLLPSLLHLLLLSICLSGCEETASKHAPKAALDPAGPVTGGLPPEDGADAEAIALDLVLAPVPGDGAVERDILRQQKALGNAPRSQGALERLGWLFVAKSRWSHDPGYYRMAGQCAALLERHSPGSPEALLLKGHISLNLHQFAQAESLALRLSAKRGSPYDFGLLGDALMEQGKLEGAHSAYQQMLDMKPGFQSYGRAAQLRWLRGDLAGAIELMEMSVQAGSPRDPDAMAWAHARLALYRFQAGQSRQARAAILSALSFRPDYPPALAVQGRIHMAQGEATDAIDVLQRAVQGDGLPEFQWALAECLREAGRETEAETLEGKMRLGGPVRDPRTLALFLASRSESPAQALDLCRRERTRRGDVFTQGALAWAHFASGNLQSAQAHADSALAEGTRDARMMLHAGIISQALGRDEEARSRLASAAAEAQMLLPSERKALRLARLKMEADTRSALESTANPGQKLR